MGWGHDTFAKWPPYFLETTCSPIGTIHMSHVASDKNPIKFFYSILTLLPILKIEEARDGHNVKVSGSGADGDGMGGMTSNSRGGVQLRLADSLMRKWQPAA